MSLNEIIGVPKLEEKSTPQAKIPAPTGNFGKTASFAIQETLSKLQAKIDSAQQKMKQAAEQAAE